MQSRTYASEHFHATGVRGTSKQPEEETCLKNPTVSTVTLIVQRFDYRWMCLRVGQVAPPRSQRPTGRRR